MIFSRIALSNIVLELKIETKTVNSPNFTYATFKNSQYHGYYSINYRYHSRNRLSWHKNLKIESANPELLGVVHNRGPMDLVLACGRPLWKSTNRKILRFDRITYVSLNIIHQHLRATSFPDKYQTDDSHNMCWCLGDPIRVVPFLQNTHFRWS